ncbi:MAG: cache domain-containing protein [Lachnospiraceae bacterium]|nr:cache domain-containing protein [Lachnospiraceae bacterium]
MKGLPFKVSGISVDKVKQAAGSAGSGLKKLGKGAGKGLATIGKGAGSGLKKLGKGAGSGIKKLGKGAGEGLKSLTEKVDMPEDMQTGQKKGRGISMFWMLILLSILPLVASILIISISSSRIVSNKLESSTKEALSIVAGNLASYCNQNQINAINASGYYDFIDSLSDRGIEMAIIAEGMPCATSIKNENGYRVREIELSQDENDIQNGYFNDNLVIDEKVYVGYYVPIVTDGKIEAMAFAGQLKDDVAAAANGLSGFFVIMAAVLISISVVVALLTSIAMAKSFKVLDRNINILARGNIGKIPERKSAIREMNHLMESTDTMQQSLSATIGNVKEVSGRLVDDIESVTRLSTASASNAMAITTSIDGMSRSTTEMDDNVQGISIQMDQIEGCINDISGNIAFIQESSNKLLETNETAAGSMDVIMDNSHRSVEAIRSITTQISNTNSAINEIHKAVDLILSISQQTNLLSLNASIEAARAGAAGRGFAVVAEEIRKLAAQSAEGADMIKNFAQTIAAESGKSVSMTDELCSQIQKEQDVILETRTQFDNQSRQIKTSVDNINGISEKITNLEGYKNRISDNIQRLGNISRENAANSDEVSKHVLQIIDGIKEVNDRCGAMNQMADTLTQSVEYFHE